MFIMQVYVMWYSQIINHTQVPAWLEMVGEYHPQMVYGIGFTNIIYLLVLSCSIHKPWDLQGWPTSSGEPLKIKYSPWAPARAAMIGAQRFVKTRQREVESSQDLDCTSYGDLVCDNNVIYIYIYMCVW